MNKLALVALTAFFTLPAFAQMSSQYSPLAVEKCKELTAQGGNGVLGVYLCPSRATDVKVYINEYEDFNGALTLKVGGKDIELATPAPKDYSFGSAEPGNALEWRYDGKKATALVFRMGYEDRSVSENGKIIFKNPRSMLYVVRLDGVNTCTVAAIPGSPGANVQARKAADRVRSLSCLSRQ